MKRLVLAAVAALALIPMARAGTVATVEGADGQTHFTGYLGPQKMLGDSPKRFYSPTAVELMQIPDHYDAREDGFVAPIRDQGQCGSCWDFSETKTLESARLAAGLPGLDLAEQDPLVNDKSNYGCDGGFMNADYWVKHGLASEADCPYRANGNTSCKKPVADKGLAWGFVGAEGRAPTEAELKAALVKYHVISVTVAAGGNDWNGGNGGKMTSCRNTGVNHMINLVGYDCRASAVNELASDERVGWRWPWQRRDPSLVLGSCSFIIANSWNTSWGDRGFAYAKQGCNQLASTTDSALWISYEGGPTPPPPPPPPPADGPKVQVPSSITVAKGNKFLLGQMPESGVTYTWSTGESGAQVYVTADADKTVSLTASKDGKTTVQPIQIKTTP